MRKLSGILVVAFLLAPAARAARAADWTLVDDGSTGSR